ncbi:MAG: GMC family oxidoreductase [Acidobacteriota bacterium]
MADKTYDIAIVGAGFSGPILAANIAEKGVRPGTGDQLRIALIEAGPHMEGTHRPGYGSPARRQRITNLVAGDPAFHWDDGGARVVGGSSLHWQASAFLPYPIDYVHWQEETGLDWTAAKLHDAVEETRREFSIHEYPDEANTVGNRLFFKVAKQMGYEPFRQQGARRNCIYCGFCAGSHMCRYDSRASSLGYVDKALKHGVDILADTLVERVVIEPKGRRGVATGLICRDAESTYEIQADHIIMACGFRKTPILLMRSGYGPPEVADNPITVVNSNIGKHIDGHPRIPGISALFDEPMGDGSVASMRGYFLINDDRPDALGRLLLRADLGGSAYPHTAALNTFAPEFGKAHKNWMKDKGLARTGSLNPAMAKASGRWSLDAKGNLTYSGDHSVVVRRAREGLELAHGILTKMGAKKITSKDVPARINSATRGSHLVGSCRAGTDPKTSVVNPYFESHDVDNLYICDASVIPRVTTGNTGTPQAAVTVFGADRIVERHFQR